MQKIKSKYNIITLIPKYLKIEIPKDWNVEVLEKMLIQSISYGILLHDDNSEGVPTITSGALGKAGGIQKNLIYVSKEIEEKFKRTRLEGGEILISLVGYTGNIAVAPMWCKGYNVTRHVGVIRLKNEYDANYFAHLLQSESYKKKIDITTIGSAQPVINLRDLSKFILIIPRIDEQQKIASILSNVDSLIEQMQKIIEYTKRFKKDLLKILLSKGIGHKKFKKVKWLFDKEIEIPETWIFEKFLDNSILKGRIGWQGLTTAEYRDDGEFCLVTGTDFKKGRIDWKNCVYVDKERFDQDKNIQLKTGDVLVTKDGTIGKIAYVDNIQLPSTLNTGVFVIRPINKKYFPLFLFYVLYSDYFNKFLNKLKAGSTINHLYQKDFVNFIFPIPSYSEQQKIASILLNIDSKILELESKKIYFENLKKGLMQNLLTGKIRVKI